MIMRWNKILLFGKADTVVIPEQSLMLISSCALVKRMVTWYRGTLKAQAVKQKSFELEWKDETFFPSLSGKWTK